jgi:hypothetical protein
MLNQEVRKAMLWQSKMEVEIPLSSLPETLTMIYPMSRHNQHVWHELEIHHRYDIHKV